MKIFILVLALGAIFGIALVAGDGVITNVGHNLSSTVSTGWMGVFTIVSSTLIGLGILVLLLLLFLALFTDAHFH